MFYTVYANIVYFYVDIKQEQSISYFTCMESQIKSTPGYNDEYPVAIVYSPEYQTRMETNDLSMINTDFDYGFYVVRSVPYRTYGTRELLVIRTDYNRERFMRLWTGYNPTLISSDEFSELPEVEAMPAYPDDGSIKIINDTVVIKL